MIRKELDSPTRKEFDAHLADSVTYVKSYESIADALTVIGPKNKVLFFSSGDYVVVENITFPANVDLAFEKGAKLIVSIGVTVTINGQISAASDQIIFDGSGSFVLKTYDEVWANWFDISGTADFGLRFNRCTTSCINTRKISTIGVHTANTTLNMTNGKDESGLWRKIEYDFSKTYFTFDIDGQPCADFTGNRMYRVYNLRGNAGLNGLVPTVGLLLSRDETGISAGESYLFQVHLNGNYSIATCFDHATEQSTFNKCKFWNDQGSTARAYILTAKNDFGVTSPFKTVYGNIQVSNTLHIFKDCDMIAHNCDINTSSVLIDGATNVMFENNFTENGGLAHYELNSRNSAVNSVYIFGSQAEGDQVTGNKAKYIWYLTGLNSFNDIRLGCAGYSNINLRDLYTEDVNTVYGLDVHANLGVEFNQVNNTTQILWANIKCKGDVKADTISKITGSVTLPAITNWFPPASFFGSLTCYNSDEAMTEYVKSSVYNRKVRVIGSDTINATATNISLLAESGTADDLSTITNTKGDGHIIMLSVDNSSHVITVKHNVGNIRNDGSVDVVIDVNKVVKYVYKSSISTWVQIS